MTSSYSDLGLELMVTGENAGTWGDKTNQNLNLIQQAVGGYEAITLTSGGTVTLAMTDATLSTARNMIIKFATATIAASTICTIPDGIEKFYIFDCSGLTDANNLTIKTVSGTGFSPTTAGAASSKIFAAYSDGTNITEISLNTLGGTIATAQLEASSVTSAILADNAVITSKISNANVTTAKIADANVTTAKIADDAVTADKLADTAVSAGDYTATNLTVDAQGRITAASSGAGAANFQVRVFTQGPSSGNITTPASASKFQAIIAGGGGGGGGGGGNDGGANYGGNGGSGAIGFFSGPVAASTSYPWAAGGGGNQGNGPGGLYGNGNPGNAGGNSNFSTFAANAGNGGNGANAYSPPGNPGSSGSAPGADGNVTIGREIFLYTNAGAGTGGNGGPEGNPGNAGVKGGVAIYFDQG